jgi:hypothetical protein
VLKMQAAELERVTGTPSSDSQSAECISIAYYQTFKKSPRSWTCTATFSPCSCGTPSAGAGFQLASLSPVGLTFCFRMLGWVAVLGGDSSRMRREPGGPQELCLQSRYVLPSIWSCQPDDGRRCCECYRSYLAVHLPRRRIFAL